MQIHTLVRTKSHRRSRRIGRGGKRGTYSGRGIKGQKARAGAKFRPAEREILKRIPKLRGYKFQSFREKPVAVSLGAIEKKFSAGDVITPKSLHEKGLLGQVKGRIPRVKIVGGGTGKKSFTFKEVFMSNSVSQKRSAKNKTG